jgi:hypothetical protein
MPTATDLVTDLPADFEVFGQAVATSMADLLGGTTGQVLSKASATDMDFAWVAPTTGDITGVTAGVGISGGGTSGDVTVTNSMATAMTTSGDLIQATGSGTFARLGTGTNGQYLTTNGTTNSWGSIAAGSLTLLSTTSLSGTTTTISSISQSYKTLYILVNNFFGSAALRFQLRPNGQNGNAMMSGVYGTATPATATTTNIQSENNSGTVTNSTSGNFSVIINNYTQTTHKPVQFYGQSDKSQNYLGQNFAGASLAGAAITSIEITSVAGSATLNGTAYIYGVN